MATAKRPRRRMWLPQMDERGYLCGFQHWKSCVSRWKNIAEQFRTIQKGLEWSSGRKGESKEGFEGLDKGHYDKRESGTTTEKHVILRTNVPNRPTTITNAHAMPSHKSETNPILHCVFTFYLFFLLLHSLHRRLPRAPNRSHTKMHNRFI